MNATKLKKFAEHPGWRKKHGQNMKQALDYMILHAFGGLETDDFKFDELIPIFIQHFGVDHVNPKLRNRVRNPGFI